MVWARSTERSVGPRWASAALRLTTPGEGGDAGNATMSFRMSLPSSVSTVSKVAAALPARSGEACRDRSSDGRDYRGVLIVLIVDDRTRSNAGRDKYGGNANSEAREIEVEWRSGGRDRRCAFSGLHDTGGGTTWS